MKSALSLVFACVVASACTNMPTAHDGASRVPDGASRAQIVPFSEVQWAPLNPARGDKGPRAADLWGDRTSAGPTGFLVAFKDGFSSPPHIHNVTYRGTVVAGLVHNDDPSAEAMWMPAGSFWTQPAGAVHITSARGDRNLAYIEIDDGPYLVQPSEQAFDRGERPVNVDPSNLVWLDASNCAWIDPRGSHAAEGPKVAFLWGDPRGDRVHGTFIKLPAGFAGSLHTRGSMFRAVVIQGRPEHRTPHAAARTRLEPGSYFGSDGPSVHRITSDARSETVLYVRTDGVLDIGSAAGGQLDER